MVKIIGAMILGAAAAGLLLCALCFGATPEKRPSGETGVGVLPEGNTGVASRYLMDEGIDTNPAVIYADGFEKYGEKPGGMWEGAWANTGISHVTADPTRAHSGSKAMEVGYMRQDVNRQDSCGTQLHLKVGEDLLFMRYYAKFEKNSEIYSGHHAGGLEALSPETSDNDAGKPANGKNKFEFMLDTWRFDDEKVPSPGYQVFYVYHPEQRQGFGEQWYPSGKVQPHGKQGKEMFGEDWTPREDVIPPRDKWICYEIMVKANTPGKRDGRAAFWMDGKLIGDFWNLRMRDVATLKVNHAYLTMCCRDKRSNKPAMMWFDDVVLSRSYVGPMNTGKKSEEKPKDKPKLVPPPGWGTTPGKTGGN